MIRDKWADNTKFIGIMLMLLGHNALANNALFDFIYSFHMPLFFFISGYYASVKNEGFKVYFLKNAKSLLLPYVIFYILTLPFGLFVIYAHPYNHPYNGWLEFLLKPLIGMITVKTTSFAFHTNGPSWFFVALFLVKMIYFVFRKISEGMKFLLGSCLICIGMLFLLKHYIPVVYARLDAAFLAYPIFIIGYICRRYGIVAMLNELSIYKKKLLVISSLLVCFVGSRLNGHVEFSAANFGNNLTLMYVTAMIGIAGVVSLASMMPQNRYISIIGGGTGIILGLHSPIQQLIKEIFAYIYHISTHDYPLILALIMVIIVSIIFVPIIICFERYFPSVFGKNRIYSNENNSYSAR